MDKNILLLFLSDVKIKKVDDKVVISETDYENVAGEKTQITNESALRYLLQNFLIDKIFIFASKKVRANILNVDGKARTHLQFSLERLKKFLPDDDRYFVFEYDEDSTGEENLKSVAKMAGVIQKFVGSDKNVTLHVDLTGGMRHINMMMLELTRLLEYSGLKIGKILYSNYKGAEMPGTVEEVQNIYDLFQLMAGVEEFVNFGSVNALYIYYKDKKISAPLKKLLDAMKDFADAIKLCHYGQFSAAIINLHDAVKDFKPTDDVEDVLMATFIARIRKDYANLIFPREKDDLRVIRWCLDNDYLQQALILYTERIPEYLGEKGIIVLSAEQMKNLKRLADRDRLQPFFYLFSQIKPQGKSLDEGKKIFCKTIKNDTWSAIKAKAFNFDEWLAILNQKLAPLNLYCPDEKEFRTQLETLAAIFKDPKLLLDLSSPELEPVRKILAALDEELKSKKWGNERLKIITKFFNNKMVDDDVPDYFTGSGFMKYPKALKVHELLNEGAFAVSIPKENFLSIVDKYFRIKDERNHSAHAREDFGEFRTVDRLRDFMQDALEEIKAALPTQ